MIRSRKRKGSNSTFSLPPATAPKSHGERTKIAKEKAEKQRTKSILGFIVLAILGFSICLICYTILNDKGSGNKLIPMSIEKPIDVEVALKADSINNSLLDRLNSKGFHSLAVQQYEAALLYFESGLQLDKNSAETNLGMSYALAGICKRDKKHCILLEQYIYYLNKSKRYTKAELSKFNSFLNGKNQNAYLYSLVENNHLTLSDR